MELILAFVVLAAGAVLALRSATSAPPPAEAPPDTAAAIAGADAAPAVEDEAATDADAGLDTEPWSPESLDDHPNGGRAAATATVDPDATLTAATPPVIHPAPPRVTTVAVRPEPLTITDDRRLDDVLAAATEEATPPSHPAIRLLVAIAGLALAFAAALLLIVRGIQALWRGFFG